MSTDCKTCQLTIQRDLGKVPDWDNIFRTEYWDVAHSYNTSLIGWLVLIPREHRQSIADLSEGETAELGFLLRGVSKGLQEVTGCVKTYVMQFAEHPLHPHVHFHVVPRFADQPPALRGPKVMAQLGVDDEDRVTDEAMNAFALELREILNRPG